MTAALAIQQYRPAWYVKHQHQLGAISCIVMGFASAVISYSIGDRTMTDALTYWWKRAIEAEHKLADLRKKALGKKENP